MKQEPTQARNVLGRKPRTERAEGIPARQGLEDVKFLRDLLRRGTDQLAAAGVDSPRVDAELLAAHVLAVPRGRLLLIDEVTDEQAGRIGDLIDQRAQRIPLQHLTGTAPFLELELSVGPGVFIPRPETELLAQWGRQISADLMVDLCSGSGALALALAAHRPNATVYAVELSSEGIAWLNRNAAGTSVKVVFGDATSPLTLIELDGTVDLVVSNPPYVPRAHGIPAEVGFDPDLAVFGGDDGLSVIKPLIERVRKLLRPGGAFGFEHDDTHTSFVELLDGFENVVTHLDLAGRPRFTTATLSR